VNSFENTYRNANFFPGGVSRVETDDSRGARPVRRSGEWLSAYAWRVKNFSSTEQISRTRMVATSQTMCRSTLA